MYLGPSKPCSVGPRGRVVADVSEAVLRLEVCVGETLHAQLLFSPADQGDDVVVVRAEDLTQRCR
eukprot:15485395-Alexandrium_andersonii.AAC.1